MAKAEMSGIDPQILSLARVRLATWTTIIALVAGAAVAKYKLSEHDAQLAQKADKEVIQLQLQTVQRDVAEIKQTVKDIQQQQQLITVEHERMIHEHNRR